ncbi:ATP-binding cassette domain-containing protein [Microbacterium xanthum]|uniref:ATP-binding cassette domain-containing protein n=1 Tax=Microbacterium xanthum TaxID=3079794 RepID=UPI002AD4917B|nr:MULTISPECIES: ATP-binding cassette domain-containing protein [unclassified Microbacterium]MDZ8172829.1 ATP-binding cassette domain-containing protein [Microbacterium sp. KSW-48]MDZ8202333.1 ATP-binding cassette domain-containing protein [Microbacterium sp. SSW1-59]
MASRIEEAEQAVRADDLSISRSGRGGPRTRVVDGMTFTLPYGRTLTIMGPTGAGKSSLLAVLAGAAEAGLSVVGGDARVHGIRVRRPGRALRRLTYLTGYLPQSAGAKLPSRFTVSELIGHPITRRDKTVNARGLAVRVAGLLDEMQLPLGAAAKYPYELSAGMRQRVAFAQALILEPTLLVADEPFANLDVEVRAAALEAVVRRRDEHGMAMLVGTNDREVVHALDADVIVMRGGHAIAAGHGVDDLLWTPSGDADHRLVAPGPAQS